MMENSFNEASLYAIPFFCFCVILLNILLHFYANRIKDSLLRVYVIACIVAYCILCTVLCLLAEFAFFLVLIILTGSYINICVCIKKSPGKASQRKIIFIILSLFFAMWITVLFGMYGYGNNLVDSSLYEDSLASVGNNQNSFIALLGTAFVFFNIGLKNYFVPPALSDISITNFNFIQSLVGLAMIGTIFPAIASVIIESITPSKEDDKK